MKLKLRTLLYLVCLLLMANNLHSQCNITVKGVPCVGNPIEFLSQSPGSSNHRWNFNNEGTNNTTLNPKFTFGTIGQKTITYNCQLSNGQQCSNQITITIKDTPDVRIRMLSNPIQCFENNQFCFRDSSLSGDKDNCIKSIKYLFSDGELITKYGSKNAPVSLPATICKSYVDPQGGEYYLTVEIEDCNGCIVKRVLPVKMKVELLPSIFANLIRTTDRCKGSTDVKFYNQSQIKRSDVKKFYWIFDDGTKDSVNWDSTFHHYEIGNKMTGIFTPKLVVYTGNGCAVTFELEDVIIYNFKPYIVKDRDSVCVGESINFELFPKELMDYVKDDKVRWDFDPGTMYGYKTFNTYGIVGPAIVSVSLGHVCGPYTVTDTVVIIGPSAKIEPDFLAKNERYQCKVRDSVHVVDRSSYYHNDSNFLDDDSLYSRSAGNLKFVFHYDPKVGRTVPFKPYDYDRDKDHVLRVWDFDDAYCLPCTTDRSKNQNVGMNCRYSLDSIEVHAYTDWDSVYNYNYVKKPINLAYFDPVLKKCDQMKIWFADSLYAVVDSTLFYADNNLGLSVKDSTPFKNLKHKKKLPAGLFGKGVFDLPYDVNVYIPGGKVLTLDPKNGPKSYVTGPQYYKVNSNYRMETDVNDSVYFIYAMNIFYDTLQFENIRPWHRLTGKVLVNGFQAGDSVNPILHRRLFYDKYPRCFNIKLTLKDTVHPYKCMSQAGAAVAMLPPSAKRLAIQDHYCYGYGNKVVEFKLSDTKPGCLTSTVWFNPDYVNAPNNWQLFNNIYYGEMRRESFLNSKPPYLGYDKEGPNGGYFYWAYNDTALPMKNVQSINVGLIIGNGLVPDECADTMYFSNFATFPRLSADIVFAEKSTRKYHSCRNVQTWVTIPGDSPDANALADASGWYMIDNQTSDTTDLIEEEYHKVTDHYKYPGKKINYTVIKRWKFNGIKRTLISEDTLITGIVNAYKAIALPGKGYNKLRDRIAGLGLDITNFPDSVVLELIWNGVGTIGIPSTGSKGCIDTTGFGHELNWYYRITDATILHYKDTSLLPADSFITSGGIKKRAYGFTPKVNSSYRIFRYVQSYFPTYCPLEKSVILAVGFKAKVMLADTILCQGKTLDVLPEFKYFDNDTAAFFGYDTLDYWYIRQSQSGTNGKEGLTIWDLSKEDDDITKPATIFGNFPYARIGYGNPGFSIGREPGAIYYKTPGIYTLRVTSSDSNYCTDTFTQKIYVTGPKAGFYTDIATPNCKTILELFDTSKIIDPCVLAGNPPCDNIYRWNIDWGDGSTPLEYFKELPKQIGHDYKQNGYYKIKLVIESVLGCRDSMSMIVFVPGPSPKFYAETSLTICVYDSVSFRNFTMNSTSSSAWLWNFGDGIYVPQNDTGLITHQYLRTGQFEVYLNQYDSIANSGQYCPSIYPDISIGQAKIIVNVLPYDTVELFADPIVVCVGEKLTIESRLKSVLNYKNFSWTTGGTTYTTTENKFDFVPDRKGKFTISWLADSIGMNHNVCPDTDTIEVFADSVYAEFVIDDSNKPEFCFRNRSKWAQEYRWGFFHDTDITVKKLKFEEDKKQTFPDSIICQNFSARQGINWVCLEAKNLLGCLDTVCRKLEFNFEVGILPPNVFTPNEDGFFGTDKEGLPGNNVFNIYTKNVVEYHLVIYDRWGVKVFESDDTNYDWNGRVLNTGPECPDGTYYYILNYKYLGKDEEEPLINGVVRIIR